MYLKDLKNIFIQVPFNPCIAKNLLKAVPAAVINIDLAGNGINTPDAIAALANLPATVTSINLSLNRINTPGAVAALANLPATVTSIDLSENRINTPGAIAALKNLPATVTSIDFSLNRINKPGAVAALANLPAAVTSIYLAGNGINTPDAVAALANLPAAVTSVNLSHNNINDTCADSLVNLLKNNRNIAELDLDGNFLSEENMARINRQSYLNSKKHSLLAIAALNVVEYELQGKYKYAIEITDDFHHIRHMHDDKTLPILIDSELSELGKRLTGSKQKWADRVNISNKFKMPGN